MGGWYDLLGTLGIGGMLATMSIGAATSGAVFLAHLDRALLPGLRRVAVRTTEALHQALGPALDTIAAQDASGSFRHAGHSRSD